MSRLHAARLNRLGQTPFWAGLAVAALLLAVAIDHGRFGADDRVSTTEELKQAGIDEGEEPPERIDADIAIVEWGFGTVTGEDGRELRSVGAVLRNSGEHPANVAIEVFSQISTNNRVVHAGLHSGSVPPDTDVYVGTSFPKVGPPTDDLRLELAEASVHDPPSESAEHAPAPAVELIDTVPLFSPPGIRVDFETEARADGPLWSAVLLFRDETGKIVGGMPAQTRGTDLWPALILEGHSVHHLEIPERLIPAGTDLDRLEVGPATGV